MLEVHVGARGPESILQVLSGNYFAGVLQQHGEYANRLPAELNPKAVLLQLAGLGAKLECSKPEDPVRGARFRPANHGRHVLEVRFYTR